MIALDSGFEPAVRLTDEERELQRIAKEQEKALKIARKAWVSFVNPALTPRPPSTDLTRLMLPLSERRAEKLVKKEIKEQLKAERRLAREGSASSKPADDKPPGGSSSRHADRHRDERNQEGSRYGDRERSSHANRHRERDDGSEWSHQRRRSRSPDPRRDDDRHRQTYDRVRSPPGRFDDRREYSRRRDVNDASWKGKGRGREDGLEPGRPQVAPQAYGGSLAERRP